MIPWELLDVVDVPGHGGKLRLYRHDRDFMIRIDHTELMNSRVHGSEELLAELALARLGRRRAPRVLIGGLGMGFTLARTLTLLDADACVDVDELLPEVVGWNRDWFGALTGQPLRDRRVALRQTDVLATLRAATGCYDAILLDVDNGPQALIRDENLGIYDRAGLAAAWTALRPGGVLAVWSAADDPAFAARLRRSGFAVEAVRVRARRTRGPLRMIWLGRRVGRVRPAPERDDVATARERADGSA